MRTTPETLAPNSSGNSTRAGAPVPQPTIPRAAAPSLASQTLARLTHGMMAALIDLERAPLWRTSKRGWCRQNTDLAVSHSTNCVKGMADLGLVDISRHDCARLTNKGEEVAALVMEQIRLMSI